MLGYKMYRDAPIPVLELARAIGTTCRDADATVQQIVVVKTPNGSVGFLVDDLADIPQVVPGEIAPFNWSCEMPALGVVSVQDSEGAPAGMLIILDLSRFGSGVAALQAAE
jgi:chemotaxis signal transduction protein